MATQKDIFPGNVRQKFSRIAWVLSLLENQAYQPYRLGIVVAWKIKHISRIAWVLSLRGKSIISAVSPGYYRCLQNRSHQRSYQPYRLGIIVAWKIDHISPVEFFPKFPGKPSAVIVRACVDHITSPNPEALGSLAKNCSTCWYSLKDEPGPGELSCWKHFGMGDLVPVKSDYCCEHYSNPFQEFMWDLEAQEQPDIKPL
eukprot:g51213.t1